MVGKVKHGVGISRGEKHGKGVHQGSSELHRSQGREMFSTSQCAVLEGLRKKDTVNKWLCHLFTENQALPPSFTWVEVQFSSR